MGLRAVAGEDEPMIQSTTQTPGPRRLVGLERHYHCECGRDERSWTRLTACPECGQAFVTAVIRRAALEA
jgi:hypothetical protein